MTLSGHCVGKFPSSNRYNGRKPSMKTALTRCTMLGGKLVATRIGWQLLQLMTLCTLCATFSACSKDSPAVPANDEGGTAANTAGGLAPKVVRREGVPKMVSPSMQTLIENAENCNVFFLEEEAYSDWARTSMTNQEA